MHPNHIGNKKNLVQNTSQLHINEEPRNKWNVMKQQGRSKWKSNGLKLKEKQQQSLLKKHSLLTRHYKKSQLLKLGIW